MAASKEAYTAVEKALRSQGGRHSSVALIELTEYLMDGGTPRTYGERFAQMALITNGHIVK